MGTGLQASGDLKTTAFSRFLLALRNKRNIVPAALADSGRIVAQGSPEQELQLIFFFREALGLPFLPKEALEVQ